MKLKSITPTIKVKDLDQAIAYYESLGFKKEWKWPEDHPTMASVKMDGVPLMMSISKPDETIPRADLYFMMEDIQGLHQKLRSENIEIPDLAKQDYGMSDFSLTDPWGNLLTFGEPSGEYSEG